MVPQSPRCGWSALYPWQLKTPMPFGCHRDKARAWLDTNAFSTRQLLDHPLCMERCRGSSVRSSQPCPVPLAACEGRNDCDRCVFGTRVAMFLTKKLESWTLWGPRHFRCTLSSTRRARRRIIAVECGNEYPSVGAIGVYERNAMTKPGSSGSHSRNASRLGCT